MATGPRAIPVKATSPANALRLMRDRIKVVQRSPPVERSYRDIRSTRGGFRRSPPLVAEESQKRRPPDLRETFQQLLARIMPAQSRTESDGQGKIAATETQHTLERQPGRYDALVSRRYGSCRGHYWL
ncbi:hypothetical protein SS05631_c21420 [Sinorhizobium sp. CCBAU 05631]|nr:hypothetical protein SS05631_c21420 [Sinorhizobium sp. CCBAU 05631]